MKRRFILALLLLACAALLFSSCVISGKDISFGTSSYRYENSRAYSAGNATVTGSVTALDVSWICGDVMIEYHDGSEVIVTEESPHTLKEEEIMRYWLDGTVLRIQFMESGIYHNFVPDKSLLIRLPAESSLADIEIETVSADITIGDIAMRELDIETVSGKIEFNNTSVLKNTDINGVSGNIKGILETEEFSGESVSGGMKLSLIGAAEVSVQMVSGNAALSFDKAPEELEIETVSGEIDVSLPKDSEFSLKFDGVSGELETDFAMTVKGKIYICGNADREYDVETVSGDVHFSFFD